MKTILATFLLLSFASVSNAYISKDNLSDRSYSAVQRFESKHQGMSVKVFEDLPGEVSDDLGFAKRMIRLQKENPGVINVRAINGNMNVLAIACEEDGCGPDTHK